MMRKDSSKTENEFGTHEKFIQSRMSQVPECMLLLPLLISWCPAVDAEEHRSPTGSVLSLPAQLTSFGHSL